MSCVSVPVLVCWVLTPKSRRKTALVWLISGHEAHWDSILVNHRVLLVFDPELIGGTRVAKATASISPSLT